MLRNFVLCLSLLCLLAVCAITTNCSSSSSSNNSGNCSGGPYNVVGNWAISISGGTAPVSGAGVINTSGQAMFFQTSFATSAPGDTVVFPTITGAGCFSGTATSYDTAGSGGTTATNSVQGTVNSATSITGTISNGDSFSIAPNSSLSGQATALSGPMLATNPGGQLPNWIFGLSPSGTGSSMTFSGSADTTNCTVSGTLNQEGGDLSSLNIFDVSMTFSGTDCTFTGTLPGFAFESNSDYFAVNQNAPGTYVYVASSSSAFVFELYPCTPGITC